MVAEGLRKGDEPRSDEEEHQHQEHDHANGHTDAEGDVEILAAAPRVGGQGD